MVRYSVLDEDNIRRNIFSKFLQQENQFQLFIKIEALSETFLNFRCCIVFYADDLFPNL